MVYLKESLVEKIYVLSAVAMRAMYFLLGAAVIFVSMIVLTEQHHKRLTK